MTTECCYMAGVCVNENTPQAKVGLAGWYGHDGHKENFTMPMIGNQTRARAEIHALIQVLSKAHMQKWHIITVYTDHQLLLDNFNQLETWRDKTWTMPDGKKPPHLREWQELEAVKNSQKMTVRLEPFPGFYKGVNPITKMPTSDVECPGRTKVYAMAMQTAQQKKK